MSIQIVGTAPETVTFSPSMSLHSGSACSQRLGMIMSAPALAGADGTPPALAWNIGTIGRIRSARLTASVSARQLPSECSTAERCEYRTPLGLPVVPLV